MKRNIDFFREFDTDKSGQLSKEEFVDAIFSLGVQYVSEQDLHSTFDSFDLDGSGTISYEELDKRLLQLPKNRPSKKLPSAEMVMADASLAASPMPPVAVQSKAQPSIISKATPAQVSPRSSNQQGTVDSTTNHSLSLTTSSPRRHLAASHATLNLSGQSPPRAHHNQSPFPAHHDASPHVKPLPPRKQQQQQQVQQLKLLNQLSSPRGMPWGVPQALPAPAPPQYAIYNHGIPIGPFTSFPGPSAVEGTAMGTAPQPALVPPYNPPYPYPQLFQQYHPDLTPYPFMPYPVPFQTPYPPPNQISPPPCLPSCSSYAQLFHDEPFQPIPTERTAGPGGPGHQRLNQQRASARLSAHPFYTDTLVDSPGLHRYYDGVDATQWQVSPAKPSKTAVKSSASRRL